MPLPVLWPNKGAGDVRWLLRDEFLVARAAGSVDATAAEPGPGTRVVIDTNSKATISGGNLSFATGGVTYGDPGYWLDAITRAAGLMLIAEWTPNGSDSLIGFDTAQTGITSAVGLDINDVTIKTYVDTSLKAAIGTIVRTTSYHVAVICRAAGNFYFIKGGAFTNWTLLWDDVLNTTATLYPQICGAGILLSDFLRVPDALWLPTPELSDGFVAANGTLLNTLSSDGLGHAEGVATGIGAGGSGASWSLAPDTYTIQTNKAINTPVAGAEILSNPGFETAGSGGADVWANWTETAGDGAIANETSIIHGGADAAKMTAGATPVALPRVTQDITVVAEKKYRIHFWTRGDGTYGGRYALYDLTNSNNIIATKATGVVGTTYTAVVEDFTTPAGCISVRFYLHCPNTNTGIAYFDDVSIKLLTLSDLLALQLRSTQDGIMDADLVVVASTQAGVAMNWDSDSSPANGVIAFHDGTNARLHKNVAGTWTEVISAAATYSANAKIRVIKSGTTYSLFYNAAAVGTASTISDAGIVDNLYHGLFNTYASNTIDDAIFRPRGTSGEYDGALDKYIR